MKRMTAAIAIALCAASIPFAAAEAQVPNLQFRTPLNYRFSVLPRSHVFAYNRQQHPGWRHRHHRALFLPRLAGPAVLYQNGEIGIPPEAPSAIPATPVQPVVYRIGETGSCNRQQVNVPSSSGRSSVNIWRC